MKTSIFVFLHTAVLMAVAIYFGQISAAAIFFVGGVLIWLLHGLDVKINKLLADRGISVSQQEISR